MFPVKKHGWQYTVFIYPTYVIKKRKSYWGTVRKAVWESLKAKKKRNVFKKARQVQQDLDFSLALIKKSSLPRNIIGNPVFLPKDTIKQDRITPLGDVLRELISAKNYSQAQQLLDQYFDLTLTLWKYGIHEKVTNFTKNNGVVKGQVVLIDFGELMNDPEQIKQRLKDATWQEAWSFKKDLPKELVQYYKKGAKKTFSVKTFQKYWKSFSQ